MSWENTIEWYCYKVPKIDVAKEKLRLKPRRLCDMIHTGI
jgi:hypothetical protein